MAMKGYSTFPKAPGLEPHHQMQFNLMLRNIYIYIYIYIYKQTLEKCNLILVSTVEREKSRKTNLVFINSQMLL